MKIVHLVPSMESGGVEQVVMELGSGLSARGVENIVVSGGGRLIPRLEKEGSRHILMPIGKKSLATFFRIGALRALLQAVRPDILHLHSRVPAWVGYLAWKKLPPEDRPGLVTSVHGFYSVNRYSAIMSRGERVIAVSNCIRDYILTHYPSTPEDHIRIIPNAISPDQHHPDYSPSREWLTGWHMSYPELKGKFTLCLPGRITRLKGQLDLIPIVRQLLERGIPAHAVIVGETKKGKEEYKNEVLREIERAGVSHAFTWTGHRQDLRDIISTCSKARRPSANQPLRRSPWADPLPGTPTAESRNNWTPSCRKETSPWGTPHPWLPCFPAGTPSPLPCPVTYPPLTRWRI